MVVLANPNAPTGLSLPLGEIERIVRGNPGQIVLVDEAYVDFGGESALPLLKSCPNLLIVRTFSKSRSLAGARLGYALANAPVIEDLNRVRCSFHPYNINRLSMLAGIEAMRDTAYFESCVQSIVRQREETAAELRALGFSMTDSRANFLFAAHPSLTARGYYEALKKARRADSLLGRPRAQGACAHLHRHARADAPSRAGNARHSLRKDDIMRSATIQRKTAETDISLALALDGTGESDIRTGCGFLDHMLTLFAAPCPL